MDIITVFGRLLSVKEIMVMGSTSKNELFAYLVDGRRKEKCSPISRSEGDVFP